MTKILLLAMVVGLLMMCGCASQQINTTCRIHPELNKEMQANDGQSLAQKEVCASRQEWRGLTQGGIVDAGECRSIELIYLGKSGDSIRIAYREFIKDMARPIFSSNVSYPATAGKLIIRNTEFEIMSVEEDHIKYKLISTPTEKCRSVYYY
jgi:hypothetical protein